MLSGWAARCFSQSGETLLGHPSLPPHSKGLLSQLKAGLHFHPMAVPFSNGLPTCDQEILNPKVRLGWAEPSSKWSGSTLGRKPSRSTSSGPLVPECQPLAVL